MIAFPDCRLCQLCDACRASVIDEGPFLRQVCNEQTERALPLQTRIVAAVAAGEVVDCEELARRIDANVGAVRNAVGRQVTQGHMTCVRARCWHEPALYARTEV